MGKGTGCQIPGLGSRSRAFPQALHPAGPHRQLLAALGFPLFSPALLSASAGGTPEQPARSPQPHCRPRLQLMRGVHMPQLIWGLAGLSSGSLGMGAKQTPSLCFNLCPQGDPVEKYHVLESVLQGGDSRLQSNTETRLTAKVLGGHGGAQSRYISLQEKEKSKGSILPSKFCSRHQSARCPLWNWGL
ncbi:uncharacterized protein ACIBXB_005127 [Morphnus guianensis]